MYRISGAEMDLEAVIDYFENLTKRYPLTFIEDPFEENDFEGFAELTARLPDTQIVGDDLFVSNPSRIRTGIEKNACNTLLLKVNQIGTVSGALEAGILALRNNYSVTVSLRSNDTNDSFIADLAVAIGAGQIKLGSPLRGERNAKYNRLLMIEKNLGEKSFFLGR
jgi:enolase